MSETFRERWPDLPADFNVADLDEDSPQELVSEIGRLYANFLVSRGRQLGGDVDEVCDGPPWDSWSPRFVVEVVRHLLALAVAK